MIKVSTYCHHRWKAVPKLGVRKYICTECSMFGFQIKGDPLHGIREHSVDVSTDLLDQYIELVQPTVTYVEPEKRSGPKPGPVRMHEYDGCDHNWVPAPEYSDNHHPRLKCTKCKRAGKARSSGEVVVFVKEYADSLRRFQVRRQHIEDEPICEHEWELVPNLGTKCINRYECKRCKWLGYRVGSRVPIQAHAALAVDKIRSGHGLRKESDGKEREPKEGTMAEATTKEECQDSKGLASAVTQGSCLRVEENQPD